MDRIGLAVAAAFACCVFADLFHGLRKQGRCARSSGSSSGRRRSADAACNRLSHWSRTALLGAWRKEAQLWHPGVPLEGEVCCQGVSSTNADVRLRTIVDSLRVLTALHICCVACDMITPWRPLPHMHVWCGTLRQHKLSGASTPRVAKVRVRALSSAVRELR